MLRAGVVLIETNGRALINCHYGSIFEMGTRLINEIKIKRVEACANVEVTESKPKCTINI